MHDLTATLAALALAGAIAAGCSSSPFDDTLLSVQASNDSALSANGGHTATVSVSNLGDGHCPLSAEAVLTVGEQTWPFGSCVVDDVPLPANINLDVKVWNGTNSTDEGEAAVGALVPGADATIGSPLSGTTTPGGSILVSVPEALRNLQPAVASFVYLGMDDPAYGGEQTSPTMDGTTPFMTVPAPQHTGHFRFSVLMNSSDPSVGPPSGVVASCFGFSKCAAIAAPDVGPLEITVVAPAP